MFVASLVLALSSCSKDDLLKNEDRVEIDSVMAEKAALEKEALMADFACALSKVVYENRSVREFLKAEAIKKFDKNYDVLYIAIKNEMIEDVTFRDLIVKASSEEFITKIESEIPLLNILFPKLFMFGLSPENYDSNDNELSVAVSQGHSNDLYLNGECVQHLTKGEVPGFYTLVVNENNRVTVNVGTRSAGVPYTFIYPEYDGTNCSKEQVTRSATVSSDLVGNKAIYAYQYFYADDSSVHSKALQRDYIYYGMTSANQPGSLNYNVNEYLSFIEVDPRMFSTISDQLEPGVTNIDPYIKKTTVSKKHTDYTEEELLDAMWMRGSFNFRVEVLSSRSQQPLVKMVVLNPEELWDFNLNREYQHETWFRPKKYTYTIDVNDFTAKRCDLTDKEIALGKWDISQESLTRLISFFEDDESGTTQISYSYECSHALSNKFSNGYKLQLGLGVTADGNVSTESSESNTTKSTVSALFTRNQGADNLGSAYVYFYDPIIDGVSGTNYIMHTYNTGTCVTFGITAY